MSASGNGNDTSGGGNDCMKELRQSRKVLKALKKRSSLRKKILIKEVTYNRLLLAYDYNDYITIDTSGNIAVLIG
jgi:hypothetical protein